MYWCDLSCSMKASSYITGSRSGKQAHTLLVVAVIRVPEVDMVSKCDRPNLQLRSSQLQLEVVA